MQMGSAWRVMKRQSAEEKQSRRRFMLAASALRPPPRHRFRVRRPTRPRGDSVEFPFLFFFFLPRIFPLGFIFQGNLPLGGSWPVLAAFDDLNFRSSSLHSFCLFFFFRGPFRYSTAIPCVARKQKRPPPPKKKERERERER